METDGKDLTPSSLNFPLFLAVAQDDLSPFPFGTMAGLLINLQLFHSSLSTFMHRRQTIKWERDDGAWVRMMEAGFV